MYEQFLSSVPLLASLRPEERSKIADALVSRVHEDGEAVVRQGDMGDTFFFVEDGEAVVTKTERTDDGQSREVEVNRLTKGDYFGGTYRYCGCKLLGIDLFVSRQSFRCFVGSRARRR